MKTLSSVAITAFAFLALANFASAQVFQVTSTSFTDNSFLKIDQIFTRHETCPNGTRGNVCVPNCRDVGGDKSPQLSWTHVPPGTTSFVVIAFDATAGFTHWGMYNIPHTTTSLPQNAGVVGSPNPQILNVYNMESYGGPCPPRTDPPTPTCSRCSLSTKSSHCPPTPTGNNSFTHCSTRLFARVSWHAQASPAPGGPVWGSRSARTRASRNYAHAQIPLGLGECLGPRPPY